MCVGMALLLQCCPCAICFVIKSSAPFNCPNSSKFIKTNAYCPSFLLSRTATPARALLCTVGIAFRSFAAGLFVALLSALPLCALVRGCVVLKTSAAHLLPLLLPQRCLCVMQLQASHMCTSLSRRSFFSYPISVFIHKFRSRHLTAAELRVPIVRLIVSEMDILSVS